MAGRVGYGGGGARGGKARRESGPDRVFSHSIGVHTLQPIAGALLHPEKVIVDTAPSMCIIMIGFRQSPLHYPRPVWFTKLISILMPYVLVSRLSPAYSLKSAED